MAGTIRKRVWTNRNGEVRIVWQADYFDQRRQRHKKQFPTKKAADAWLSQAKIEVRDGTHTPDSASTTIGEAAELWLQRCRTNALERGSLRTYEQYVRLAIAPLLGQLRLSRLTAAMVEDFRDDLLAAYAYLRAQRILAALRQVLKHAQGRGLVAQNVASGVRIGERPRDSEQLEIGRSIPTREEAARLFTGADGWLRIMLLLAASTGMRSSELRGLTWEAVDLKAERIVVRNRADQWGTSGKPKSKAGQRTLDLTPTVAAELRQWWATPGRHPVYVFPGRGGTKPRNPSTVTKAVADLQIRLGITRTAKAKAKTTMIKPKYVLHELRHFFASALIELGYTSKRLQVVMGHNKAATTYDIYGHLFAEPGDRKERLAALESFVFAKPG
jgi:integrase